MFYTISTMCRLIICVGSFRFSLRTFGFLSIHSVLKQYYVQRNSNNGDFFYFYFFFNSFDCILLNSSLYMEGKSE